MPDFRLKKTVRVDGKDVTVPITYEREGGYYVYEAPTYGVIVKRLNQADAYKAFEEKLTAKVAEVGKSRNK
jgi:hypothetical protein